MSNKKESSNFPDKNIGRGPGYLRGTGEKPKDFKSTGKRLLNYIKPHNLTLITVFSGGIKYSFYNNQSQNNGSCYNKDI